MLSLRWHLRISLAALGLMLIVPFVYPHHYNPIPSFYQELIAVILSLPALTLLLRRRIIRRIEIPEIAILPLGIGALVLLQFVCGKVVFPSQALLFLLYLLCAVFMLIVGRSLRRTLGLTRLVTPLAYALLCGALLAAALLAAQLFAPALNSVFVLERSGSNGIGNLGQPNHLANYLWLGIVSAITLHAQGRIGKTLLASCLMILLGAASLTGSRSVALYAVGCALLSIWAARHFAHPALKRSARIALLLLPLAVVLHWALGHLEASSALAVTTSGERLLQPVGGASQRLQLWRTGFAVFADHPWLGAGVGQFPWESYVLAGAQADSSTLGGAEHAHNLFVQLAAEFGGVAPLLVLILGWRWWITFVRQPWSPAHGWIAIVLLVEAVHSQLEYPLWYAFFLGIAALALGAGSQKGMRPQLGRIGRTIVAAALLLAALTLANLGSDYGRLEAALNPQLAKDKETRAETLAGLEKLRRESLLGHYVDLIYANTLSVDREALKDKIVVTQTAMRLSPAEQVSFNLAYLLALDGRLGDSQLALRRALATHPAARARAIGEVRAMLTIYPELSPLLNQLEEHSERP